MFHYEHGVAQIAQALQIANQFADVPGVETNAGLIEDIQYPHESGTDLRRQANPLSLASGERCRGAIEGKVLKSHVRHKLKTGLDLFENGLSDDFIAPAQSKFGEENQCLGNRKAGNIIDGLAIKLHLQAFPP